MEVLNLVGHFNKGLETGGDEVMAVDKVRELDNLCSRDRVKELRDVLALDVNRIVDGFEELFRVVVSIQQSIDSLVKSTMSKVREFLKLRVKSLPGSLASPLRNTTTL